MEITENAYAKLNLTLDITGKEYGYHTLDMVVASIDIKDIVTVRERDDNEIKVSMDGVLCGEDNSAYKAVKLMQDRFDVGGFDVEVEKHIPIKAGLGGSTADGVAVIRGICKIKGIALSDIPNTLLMHIGSDAPCMFYNGVKRVRGIGEKIDFIDIKIPYKVAIIAGSGVDTARAYSGYDSLIIGRKEYTKAFIEDMDKDGFDVATHIGNNLLTPAKCINSDIERAFIEMLGMGANAVSMSGSGSAVFGLFEDEVPRGFLEANFVY